MKAVWNVVVVVVLVAAIGGVFALKRANQGSKAPAPAAAPAVPPTAVAAEGHLPDTPAPANTSQALPRLVELGGAKCIPCQMMMPVLDALKKEYAGRLSVEFYDVQQDPSLGLKYGIQLIPTQILYDASGKELFRHVGFFAKEDILAKWKELGVNLAGPTQ